MRSNTAPNDPVAMSLGAISGRGTGLMCRKRCHVARSQQHQRSTLPVDIVYNEQKTVATPT